MEPFTRLTGLVAPLDLPNVDTDQIIPKQFLKRIERTGFGPYLFYDWRFLPDGAPNPHFEMNAERYKGATILLARSNFGCGSSREHAPWSLLDYGFRAMIAPSFADIFYNNCFKNGILPVTLPPPVVEELFKKTREVPGYSLTVNLEDQCLMASEGFCLKFEVDPFRRHCLLHGLDDIGLTLEKEERISCYELREKNNLLYTVPSGHRA